MEQMEVLVSCFLRPFKMAASSKKPPCSHEDVNSIFLNSETVLFLHQIFLKGLTSRMESWPTLVLGEFETQREPGRAGRSGRRRSRSSPPIPGQAKPCLSKKRRLTQYFLRSLREMEISYERCTVYIIQTFFKPYKSVANLSDLVVLQTPPDIYGILNRTLTSPRGSLHSAGVAGCCIAYPLNP